MFFKCVIFEDCVELWKGTPPLLALLQLPCGLHFPDFCESCLSMGLASGKPQWESKGWRVGKAGYFPCFSVSKVVSLEMSQVVSSL